MVVDNRGQFKKFNRTLLRTWRRFLDWVVDLFLWLTVQPRKGLIPPINNKYLLLSASELAHRIRTRQVTSEEIVQALITRIQEVQPLINATIDQRFEEALGEARQVDKYLQEHHISAEEIETDKPFLGVPFTIKGNIACKGMLIDAGMLSRKGSTSDEDAEVVKRLRAAGAIPLALTNLPEMAMSFSCYNKIHGHTLNPFDLSMSPGGSSGGEAALITSAGSVLGLGNDLLGSLRIPAALTGIFSHKPTGGIIPWDGVYPIPDKALRDELCVGPMCRYASDLLPAMKVLTLNKHNRLKFDKQVDLKRLKIYFAAEPMDSPLVPKVNQLVQEAVHKAVRHLEKTSETTVEEFKLSQMAHSCWLFATVTSAKVKRKLGSYLADQEDKEVDIISELIKSCFGLSDHTFFPVLFCTMEKIIPRKGSWLHDAYTNMYEKSKSTLQTLLDDKEAVWILPSFSQSSLHHLETSTKYHILNYFALFNVLGLPATQVPMGVGPDGYPFGIQIVAGKYNDHLTIAVAEELERAFGGWIGPSPVNTDNF